MCLKEYGFVVGFSSPSGGGKTTVVSKVAELLRDAVVITFDDYDGSNIHPTSYRNWLAEGADYNAWQTPRLTEDLKRLKQKQAIISPIDGQQVWPASYILFDAPLGRAHCETGQYIDLMVYLDTPLKGVNGGSMRKSGLCSGPPMLPGAAVAAACSHVAGLLHAAGSGKPEGAADRGRSSPRWLEKEDRQKPRRHAVPSLSLYMQREALW